MRSSSPASSFLVAKSQTRNKQDKDAPKVSIVYIVWWGFPSGLIMCRTRLKVFVARGLMGSFWKAKYGHGMMAGASVKQLNSHGLAKPNVPHCCV
jgi:hypothetical protein